MTDYPIAWYEQTYDVMRRFGIRQVPYLPDGALSSLIKKCTDDPSMDVIPLTTEEEGVMQIAGAWLGGDRSVLLIQCGGVGNCVNAFSLLKVTGTPCVMVVTMRGVWGEFNPWQVPMGKATRGCFELFDFTMLEMDDELRAGDVMTAACQLAYGAGERVAVLVTQQMLGAKNFSKKDQRRASDKS